MRMLQLAALALLLCALGCFPAERPSVAITLATTTSTRDSGLLDELIPAFERQSGIEVKVVAVGSGQALELGRRGDADVLLTHSPAAEEDFMREGSGEQRQAVMYNDFVIAGPADDPARVRLCATADQALLAISRVAAPMVSRGDDSGTHQKELEIWKAANMEPSGDWYIVAGTGMAQALRMANEKRAYVLTDRATFLAVRRELELVVLLEGDPMLLNHYTVISVSQEKHRHIRLEEARAFANFLVSEEGQEIIASFGRAKFGEPLFTPDARPQQRWRAGGLRAACDASRTQAQPIPLAADIPGALAADCRIERHRGRVSRNSAPVVSS